VCTHCFWLKRAGEDATVAAGLCTPKCWKWRFQSIRPILFHQFLSSCLLILVWLAPSVLFSSVIGAASPYCPTSLLSQVSSVFRFSEF
jgi:hypothetical protein